MISRRRVLLIEDMDATAGPVSRELEAEYGYEVTWVKDPRQLPDLVGARFDVAVVDLLYDHLSREFMAKVASGKVNLSAGPLLISGLTGLHVLRQADPPIPAVVWTSIEANRRLHLLYAAEQREFGVTSFCSKSPGTGSTDVLHQAVEAAYAGKPFADPTINAYLPPPRAATLNSTLLKSACWRAVWRAIAGGARDHAAIERITPYKARYIRNEVGEMRKSLLTFDRGQHGAGPPLSTLISYARDNKEFFLDDIVKQLTDRLD